MDSTLNLSVDVGEKWFSQLPKSDYPKKTSPSLDTTGLKAEAENLLESEVKIYRKLKQKEGNRDFKWVKKILNAGTLSDKISAHTLLLQDSPVYNVHSLEVLLGLVNTKGKRECLMAIGATQELFSEEILIEDRKLRLFREQPFEHIEELSKNDTSMRQKILILWIFEEKVKLLYKKFIQNVVAVSHDTIEKTKMKAISTLAKLLISNCEEEQLLLESITNKIGDPIPKVGSHACYQLGLILRDHSQMKFIIVLEVERLLFRSNVAERTKYYSLCFLNQILLTHEEFKLANHLIAIYFGQFKLFTKQGEVNTKMMSALLTGVTRAYPYAKLKEDILTEQLNAMYRLVHLVSFNISVQAMMLIFQVLDSKQSISERFYSVLYRKLLDPVLSSSSRQSSFLNLVYKALKKDTALRRIKAFVKRLLQVALYQNPPLQSGIMIVISELNKLHPDLFETVQVYEESESDCDEHYEDVLDEDEKVETSVIKTESDDEKEKCLSVKHGGKIPSTQASWIHRNEKKHPQSSKSLYNLDCRNPLYANADYQDAWELLFLKNSFHPSVSLFAHQVTNSTPIKYSGDPLLDFTTARFLERFVYKNPKKVSESFQSDPRHRLFGKRKIESAASKQTPVTDEQYLNQDESKIPVEELFMYKYLKAKAEKRAERRDNDSDIESVCSEEFEGLLENILTEDEGKDRLNFAKELGLHKQKEKKRKVEKDDESVLSDGEDDFEEELELDSDDFVDMEDDNSELGEENLSDDDIPRKKSRKGKKDKDSGILTSDMLADAEEFSAMLEEGARNEFDGTTEAVRVTSKTSAKQLKWERERERERNNNYSKNKYKFAKQYKRPRRK